MSYLKTNKKIECCGCKACEQVCPQKCISMVEDDELFFYPVIDNALCTDCGLCQTICPHSRPTSYLLKDLIEQEVYAMEHHDEATLLKSSSGGAFTAIAENYCDENYIIFGAAFENDFKVRHSYVKHINEIGKFRKSKCIQSNTKDTYVNVKEFLDSGKKVLFTGTPCQIGALKSFLDTDYEKLLCVDILCRGVPSQGIFEKYIHDFETDKNFKVAEVSFKEKVLTNNKYTSRNIHIRTTDGTEHTYNIRHCAYLKGFHSSLFARPSCYVCRYSNADRASDITIGDYWGIQKIYPEMDSVKGVSLIISNTKKGAKVVKKITVAQKLIKTDLAFAKANNRALRECFSPHPNRKKFFSMLKNHAFNKIVKKCTAPPLYRRIFSTILPADLKSKIKQFIK